MKKILFLVFLTIGFSAQAKLKVVATTTDLQALVEAIGGENIEASSIAKGTQDVHQIEAKPSFMLKMRDADLVVAHGLELETAWLVPLIQGSRNAKIRSGSRGLLELGGELRPIEIPTGEVSRAQGDVHPGGNPHFQLDPLRMGEAAVLVAARLAELDGAHADLYKTNAQKFKTHLEDRNKEWAARLKKTGIQEVVTYHKSFAYFMDRYGLKNSLQLEPRPGIPPTASHLLEVIAQMKARKIRLVLIENYFDDSPGEKIRHDLPDTKVVSVPISVGGAPSVKSTEDLIENLVKAFEGVTAKK